ncbi:MAG: T9SS type A sorting domain-containing protein [Bacteroidetes bacterium]|nr:T9SS type A sorting domain-containing protein [Bacteroidota bacterium]
MNIKTLLSTSFIAFSFSAAAQNAVTYAITGDGAGNFSWSNIRKVDIGTGKITANVFERDKTPFVLADAATKAPSTTQTLKFENNGATSLVQLKDAPTVTMVAAAAYDKKHDKLFFTPMRIGELRWLDLSAKGTTPTFYAEKAQLLNKADLMDEANHITRMDIAADGNGYAITNDGNHLIRFTTGKKTIVTDLGNLIDDEKNPAGVSIHNRCTSWGGDMVADAYGKLYVISANHMVFKVDVDSRIASYIGAITGLPATYTTNGAAVDDDDNIIVSSANSFEGFFKFKMADLAATKIEGSDNTFSASDLANGNLLYQKEADAKKTFDVPSIAPAAPINTDARIFPNPVTAGEFRILFDGQKAGKYHVAITDLSGRAIMAKDVTITVKLQNETVRIGNTIAKGMYLVKVTDDTNQLVFTERIVVQ